MPNGSAAPGEQQTAPDADRLVAVVCPECLRPGTIPWRVWSDVSVMPECYDAAGEGAGCDCRDLAMVGWAPEPSANDDGARDRSRANSMRALLDDGLTIEQAMTLIDRGEG